MEEASTIGLDLAKHVFQAHGASTSGAVVFRKRLRRDQVDTSKNLPVCAAGVIQSHPRRAGATDARAGRVLRCG